MSFIVNAILAAVTAAVLMAVGLSHYGAARFEAATHPLSESYELGWKDIKTAHAQAIVTPKIVLVGGSGALFGLRCAVFTRALGMPCVNGALPGQPALGNLLGFDRSLLRPGDVALLQLDDAMYFAPSAPPATVPPTRLFRIDLRYLLTGAAERLLASTGYSFFGPITGTLEGDRRGHVRANAAANAEARSRQTIEPTEAPIADATRGTLTTFFAWTRENRILVVGTMPPTYDDWTVPASREVSIRQLYLDAGLPFVVLPNRSRYPRDCFWDSVVRLNEECQALQSKGLADALASLLKPKDAAQ
jgi:hypothetical protein